MALITCPDCNREISSEAKSCPNCGLPTKRIRAISQSTIENQTTFHEEKMDAGQRFTAAFLSIFFGCAALFIPVIGCFAGPILILMGLLTLTITGTAAITQKGTCPYCALTISNANAAAESFLCVHCKQPIIVKAPYFYTVAASHALTASQTDTSIAPTLVEAQLGSAESALRIAKGGEDIGEHPISRVQGWIDTGFVSEDDFFWDESIGQWRSIRDLRATKDW
jgi:hypothetical protein